MTRFKIKVKTHGFSVQVLFQQDKKIITDFNRTLEVYETRWNYQKKRPTRQLKFTYATCIMIASTYGLHRNVYQDFMAHLKYHRVPDIDIEITILDPREGWPCNLIISDDVEPRDYQIPIIDWIVSAGSTKVLPLQTGLGKALDLDTPIKIPKGWKLIRNIKVGDIVIAKDGTHTKVTGVYPQGIVKMYRVLFGDGRYVNCCGEHLWKVYVLNYDEQLQWRIINTVELIQILTLSKSKVYIDLIEPEECEPNIVIIDPYLMGIYLSDEYYNSKIISTINSSGNIIRTLLPDELFKKLNYKKFIPSEYLNGSIEQRLSILQGLLDAAGIVKENYDVSYCSSSLQLAKDVQYLVRSLGGIATLNKIHSFHPCNGERKVEKISYVTIIRYKKPSDLFRLAWKKALINDNNQRNNILKLRVTTVLTVPGKDAKCISIDHPEKLFVIKDFIVTHNTVTALITIPIIGVRTAIIAGAMHVEVWKKDSNWVYTNSKEEIQVICGKKKLIEVIELGKKGLINKSILIFTINTIRDYLTEYEQNGKSTYGCIPSEFYQVLGVGFRITDEAHENLHFNFRHDIETNVTKALYLSATIQSHDSFTNKMYDIIFPRHLRYTDVKWRQYILVKAIGYHIRDSNAVKCSGDMGYSHNMFEQWIIADNDRLYNYLIMIKELIVRCFIKGYIVGQKLLIYMSSIEMCKLTAEFLNQNIECIDFKIHQYTGEHEDEVLHDNDIVITTPKKSKSGKDIKGLVLVINTVAIDSMESNIQMVGRLREIDKLYPGVEPVFIYLVCLNIPKHIQYHESKLSYLRPKVKNIQAIKTSFMV